MRHSPVFRRTGGPALIGSERAGDVPRWWPGRRDRLFAQRGVFPSDLKTRLPSRPDEGHNVLGAHEVR